MFKKLVCFTIGIALAVLELLLLKVSPMTVLSTIELVAGFVALTMALYSDYVVDRKITVPMIVAFSCGYVAVALGGVAFTTNRTVWFVIAGVFAVAGVGAVLYEKKLKKK